MKKRLHLPVYALVLFTLSAANHPALASKTAGSTKGELATGTTYTWYDGKRQRTLWLNPNLIAEFDPKPQDHTQSKGLAASATPVKTQHSAIRFWRHDSKQTGKTTAQAIASLAPVVKISPVLHDGPSESKRMRALPGNIIVHLNPDWDNRQVSDWLAKHSLQMIKPLKIGRNILLIKTDAGLAALTKANEIYLSGEVVAAYPDWWTEVQKK